MAVLASGSVKAIAVRWLGAALLSAPMVNLAFSGTTTASINAGPQDGGSDTAFDGDPGTKWHGWNSPSGGFYHRAMPVSTPEKTLKIDEGGRGISPSCQNLLTRLDSQAAARQRGCRFS